MKGPFPSAAKARAENLVGFEIEGVVGEDREHHPVGIEPAPLNMWRMLTGPKSASRSWTKDL